MNRRDYYEVLGVERNASDQEIKSAYRRLAMEYHPDRNKAPDAEERFKEASEAYQVLADAEKRRIYDRAGFDGLRNVGFSGFSSVGLDDIFSSFGDIFGDLFGLGGMRSRRQGGPQRGAGIRYNLTLSFEEAVFGTQKDISFDTLVACEACDGKGTKPGSQVLRCKTCQGQGQIVHGQGLFLISSTCPECQGTGVRHSDPCRQCRGDGRVRGQRTLTLKIPPGADDGMGLRFQGGGEAGPRGGPAGDLQVALRVKEHKTLRRDADDLYAEAAVDMTDAALGTTLTVQGVDGEAVVTVPAGTQPDDVITLKKKGVPHLGGGGRGDLHVILRVRIPRSLTSRQRELLEEFAGKTQQTKKRHLFS